MLLIVALIFSLQFKPVQTYVAKKAANYLSKELKTKVEVGSLYIKPFKSVVLEGLYVEDLEKDTLIYSPKVTVDISEFSIKNRKIAITTAQMDDGKFFIKQYKDTTTNLQFIINYFDTGSTKPKKNTGKPFDITFEKIVLNGIDFKYKNFNSDTIIKGINFNDLYLRNLNTTILGLDTKNHLVKANFKNLTFKEKSGFYLKNLTTTATIDTNQMEFSNLLLETPETRISDYLLFKYNSFKDFNQFVNKVHMDAQLKNTRLHSKDLAYFIPQLNSMDIDLRVNGKVNGFVDNLKAKQLEVKIGKATYMKGDFSLKGLPDINHTLLSLNFDQVYTNKKDIDYIVSKVTGKSKTITPPILAKFGNISFKGKFAGFTNDFIAYGEFKTALGKVISDINMKIPGKGTPTYSGIIKAYDFDLGSLLDNQKLGRTTLVANVKGSGFNINRIKEQIKSEVTYFDFNGYRYSNINVDGTYGDNLFNGLVKVNDRNLKLDFNGGVNLGSEVPIFNFKASIREANLYALKLTNDTVQIEADMVTSFTGNNLDNIQGSFDIQKVRFTNSEHSFVVDSVQLSAIGIGRNRELKINSDILDASIKGEYDLNTLPSYFKSVAKKYIPSLDVKMVKPEPQNFEFSLTLKYFEPLSLLFFPDIKVPEQASITGLFNSEENIANLSGFAKLITYKKIRINNLIIDQTTTPLALNLFVTSDQIDLSDNLYIKNVNIANILSNDSLQLNIKLSDKTAINQLDLNGLVEFSDQVNSKANLSILPSDVIINEEVWRIQDKVAFKFENGKTLINDFELFRDNQLLTVNGVISDDPDDELVIGFNKFKLTTFNPLTSSLGINLEGELNGNAKVAAINKTPRIEAALTIDTLQYNNIAIGDLSLSADYNNSSQLVNVKMDIMKGNLKALDIAGTYNANSDQNNLDMDVKMNNNEIIIFQPFLKKLVSNLNGKVSADIKVTGKLTSPKINGNLSLNNAGMTVIYLKTPYHLTDNISIKNSVLKLNNLVLKDINEHEAIANGTVDMANPNNPDIHLTLVANNFMALNTTSKDNPLYYGTAYGSGVFSFNGPTDNMKINIDANTEEGTVFSIPLNSSETVRDNDFITFVAKDSSLTVKKETSFKGLTMQFDLRVDENSEVNIITDLGKLNGRGDGALDLRITSLGDFEMYGDYLISKGKFEFTAQDVINKIFEIRKGGSIRWTGNPTEAAINLNAVYSARTSIKPLYDAAGRNEGGDQRVLAEAVMSLKGSLLHPDIVFDLNFPADAYIKDELQSYLSDVNNVNQQAISLIVRRSFTPGTGADLLAITPTFVNAGAELFFNQLNNIITQSLNLNFVDFNIRSFNEASASLRLLDGRLILTGGVTDPRSQLKDFDVIGGSSIARDVEAQYLINKDGSLILRASNRLNNRNFLNSNMEYVSALGLVYRQEFDNASEFLSTLIGKKRREERRKKELEANKNTVATKPEDKEEADK